MVGPSAILTRPSSGGGSGNPKVRNGGQNNFATTPTRPLPFSEKRKTIHPFVWTLAQSTITSVGLWRRAKGQQHQGTETEKAPSQRGGTVYTQDALQRAVVTNTIFVYYIGCIKLQNTNTVHNFNIHSFFSVSVLDLWLNPEHTMEHVKCTKCMPQKSHNYSRLLMGIPPVNLCSDECLKTCYGNGSHDRLIEGTHETPTFSNPFDLRQPAQTCSHDPLHELQIAPVASWGVHLGLPDLECWRRSTFHSP